MYRAFNRQKAVDPSARTFPTIEYTERCTMRTTSIIPVVITFLRSQWAPMRLRCSKRTAQARGSSRGPDQIEGGGFVLPKVEYDFSIDRCAAAISIFPPSVASHGRGFVPLDVRVDRIDGRVPCGIAVRECGPLRWFGAACAYLNSILATGTTGCTDLKARLCCSIGTVCPATNAEQSHRMRQHRP